MTRSDVGRRILQHIADTESPLVLITAPYGSSLGTLLLGSSQSTAVTHFEPLPATVVDGTILQRRLTVLQTEQSLRPYQAALGIIDSVSNPASTSAPQRVLTISNVELLDYESQAVVDVLARDHRVGLIMTSSSPSRLGFRYGRWLQDKRALAVKLPEPTFQEIHQILARALGSPPTAILTEYLLRVTCAAPQGIDIMLRAASGADFIATIGSRSALVRSPSWTDRRTAADVMGVLETDLGAAAMEILQRVAVEENPPLRDFTEDDTTRDAIFWMIEAGLLAAQGPTLRVPQHHLRHSLVLSSARATIVNRRTPSQALHQLINCAALDKETSCWAAQEHLGQGLLHHAQLLISDLPHDDPAARYLAASIHAASGAPRTALEMLNEDLHRGIESDEMRALRAFISGALLGSPQPEDKCLGDVAARLHTFSDYNPQPYLAGFSAPSKPLPATSADAHQGGALLNISTLSRTTAAVIDGYAAALNDDRQRAESSLAMVAAVPCAELPITAVGWIAERFAAARIIAFPGEDLLPKGWAETTTPEQWLLHAFTEQMVHICDALLRGADSVSLRHRLEDLWAQFETGLPAGSTVSRRFLETLDYAVGGKRSAEVIGPLAEVPLGLAGTLRYAGSDTFMTIGRLLHTPEDSLEQAITAALEFHAPAPGGLRVILRCLVLRRSARLSAEALHLVTTHARKAGVEKAVLSAAAALSESDEARQRVLNGPLPEHPEFRFCSAATPVSAARKPSLERGAAQLLTARERQIATHLMNGSRTASVASRLGISRGTVQTHIRNIYRKLDVGSRTQLRARAAATGARSE